MSSKIKIGLPTQNKVLEFVNVDLQFEIENRKNIFLEKKDKTLKDTLLGAKYKSLQGEVETQYKGCLDKPIGIFLCELKSNEDLFYRKFLNKYGDLEYCRFGIADEKHLNKTGLYIYTNGEKIVYVGRSRAPFGRRINQGYGNISPKNCYKDGQATNCHINSLVALNKEKVKFYVCAIDDEAEIKVLEKVLISSLKLAWNTQKMKSNPLYDEQITINFV